MSEIVKTAGRILYKGLREEMGAISREGQVFVG